MPYAEIRTRQALFALAKLYSELRGNQLRRNGDTLAIRTSIEHVGATILLLDPAFDLANIRPVQRNRKNPAFPRGGMFRAAIVVMRTANAPMTVTELSLRVFASRGVHPTHDQLTTMKGGLRSSLLRHEGKTVVKIGDIPPAHWALK